MGSDYEYASDCLPDRWTVLGVRLKPLLVGHLLLLERVQSPFLTGEKIMESDLTQAVWICANSYSDGVAQLYSKPTFNQKIWTWRKTLACVFKKSTTEKESVKLANYIIAARTPSKKILHDAEGEKTYAPFVMVLKRDLMSYWGYSSIEVLEMPLRQAMIEREGYLEANGAASFPEPWEGGA